MLKLHPNSARLGALTEYSQLNDERDQAQHLRQTAAGREYSTNVGLLQGLVPANQGPTRQVLVDRFALIVVILDYTCLLDQV